MTCFFPACPPSALTPPPTLLPMLPLSCRHRLVPPLLASPALRVCAHSFWDVRCPSLAPDGCRTPDPALIPPQIVLSEPFSRLSQTPCSDLYYSTPQAALELFSYSFHPLEMNSSTGGTVFCASLVPSTTPNPSRCLLGIC